MKKVLLAFATMLVGLLATLGFAPAAHAYPEITCNVTVDSQVVIEGEQFTATGTAAATGDDIHWVMTFNGETRTGNGTVFMQTFTAPDVDKRSVFPLTARSTSAAAGACQHTADITVLPSGAVVEPPSPGQGGGLPNTGGPRLILLVAGVLLLLGGTGAVVVSRYRSA